MPLSIDDLQRASSRYGFAKMAKSIDEARSQALRTAFLCHSHKDADLVRGLLTILSDKGWRIYVDWGDTTMPETPTRETAEKIQTKIRTLDFFLFLATPNSTVSRWCPWEIGYADGKKSLDSIMVIPTTDRSGQWYGNEYLQLYRRVDLGQGDALGVWRPGEKQGVLVENLR